MPQHLTEVQRAQIVALLQEGNTVRYVAERMQIPRSTVSRAWRNFQERGRFDRREGSGRRRITTPREDRQIIHATVREPAQSARQILDGLNLGRRISDVTVRNRLNEAGLHSRSRVRVPALTQQHRQARLHYARTYKNWTQRQWRNVLFTDESRFCLFNSDRRVRVWRRQGQRYDRSCVQPVHAFNGGSVMVWGGIWYNGRTELVIQPPPGVTAIRYIDEVLRPHILPVGRRIGRNFVFMHDNARPHTAIITRQFLREHRITVLPHPPMSPDLNPIEHIWDLMGRRLRDLERPPTNLHELSELLVRIWNEIPQREIQACINMEERLQEVIRQRGGNTHY